MVEERKSERISGNENYLEEVDFTLRVLYLPRKNARR